MAKPVRTNLDFGGVARILGLPAPQDAAEAVTKAYVDGLVEGLAWKDDCRVATQGNINLSAPGAAIDGVTMALNDRVLVKAQTNSSENGIYIWNGASTPMTRALDANTASELWQAVTTVREGTDAGTTWRQTYLVQNLGTDPVQWTSFGAAAPTASETVAGVIRIATQAETDAGVIDNAAITPLKLANWVGRIRKHQQAIGDGTNTLYTVTHNLGTRDVAVAVYKNGATYDEVLCDVRRPTVNTVELEFASAPASNEYVVVVIG